MAMNGLQFLPGLSMPEFFRDHGAGTQCYRSWMRCARRRSKTGARHDDLGLRTEFARGPFLWKQEVWIIVEPGSTHYVVVAYKPERSWALPAAGAPLLLQEITASDAEPLLRDMKAR